MIYLYKSEEMTQGSIMTTLFPQEAKEKAQRAKISENISLSGSQT